MSPWLEFFLELEIKMNSQSVILYLIDYKWESEI